MSETSITIPPAPTGEETKPPTQAEWPYQNEYGIVWPLDVNSDAGQKTAVSLYERMKEDGLQGWTFPGSDSVSLLFFLSCLKTGFIVGMTPGGKEIVGFGSLPEIEGPEGNRKASTMYCFFRKYHRSETIREIAKLAASFWFNRLGLRLLMGSCLAENLAARKFAASMGFVECGVVPGFFFSDGRARDAVMLEATRPESTGENTRKLM